MLTFHTNTSLLWGVKFTPISLEERNLITSNSFQMKRSNSSPPGTYSVTKLYSTSVIVYLKIQKGPHILLYDMIERTIFFGHT